MILGAIGDDFTGSSDLGLMLAKGGMRTVQYVGVPSHDADRVVEAGVVALKSRSIPSEEAVRKSLQALAWLRAQGCRQYLFKICSTFDSTPEGNIGPVAEALMDALGGAAAVPVCPVFPATGRTLYQGHLFVNDKLLSESGLENHPINPMTDPDIRRWLARQSRGRVGHVPLPVVRMGAEALADHMASDAAAGRRLVIVDAIEDSDLEVIAEAAWDAPLLVGGSGIALGIPEMARRHGMIGGAAEPWRGVSGKAVALSGSCSSATRSQVAEHARHGPQHKVDPDALMAGTLSADHIADWAMRQNGLPLIYSSADPATVKAAQERHGGAVLAERLEGFFGALAVALRERGAQRILVAGGETSGAVVTALGVKALAIGPEIDPGVPVLDAEGLGLALKSGNFGAPDFFHKAMTVMGP